ncbi:MAG: NADH-quinone oxidoreductase subunit C [Thaumarchaeota archaeon]|nr:NADH-quinone oxidoreductase subunit C [Nitrososphaerota archaeon]
MSQSSDKEHLLLSSIKGKFGDKVRELYVNPKRMKILVDREDIVKVALFVRDLGFDQVISAGGTDFPQEDSFVMDYHLISVDHDDLKKIIFNLSTKFPKKEPKIPTLMEVWSSAEYHEQETFEMLGIIFETHPRMERLLLPEDWNDIPPLRKEFKLPSRLVEHGSS